MNVYARWAGSVHDIVRHGRSWIPCPQFSTNNEWSACACCYPWQSSLSTPSMVKETIPCGGIERQRQEVQHSTYRSWCGGWVCIRQAEREVEVPTEKEWCEVGTHVHIGYSCCALHNICEIHHDNFEQQWLEGVSGWLTEGPVAWWWGDWASRQHANQCNYYSQQLNSCIHTECFRWLYWQQLSVHSPYILSP